MASTQPSSSQCEIHGLENLEEYYLVWCDKLANNVVKENIEQKLRTIINYLKIFDNIEICEKYIRENIKNLKVILIVSDQFGQIIVPRLQDLSQLMAVYVYCEEKQSSEQWTQQFQKNTPSPVHFIPVGKVYIQVLFFNIQVKGVLTQIDELIESIKHDQKHREKYDETISISIFDPSNKEKSTTGLNSSFMYQQLLTDILIQMESTSADKKELVDACQFFYKDNGEQLKILNDFDQTYSSNQALWWYPRESFLYRLLNKALRIANIDLLFLFRFFIRDLHKQLGELYRSQQDLDQQTLRVYRGQIMSNDEIEQMKSSTGQLLSMNSFLSTSSNRQVALEFATISRNIDGRDMCLLEISADKT
ncbi:unnamed protein product [Didymodactylos carnosus]|uniref:Uncharacterized protein n=1 Tax=Didymodactylos carnosus TaxID=1234261 RepID=A0A8S2H0K2_9BILA|nr:unnamed protein product [Didymodactylos carnosus]CAF3583635.1 unnamed protein product [Didymodactylos carnosus]